MLSVWQPCFNQWNDCLLTPFPVNTEEKKKLADREKIKEEIELLYTMCLQGRTVVSLGSDKQMTHSFPESVPSALSSTEFPIPKISCSSYLIPSAHSICFTTRTCCTPFSFSNTAWVIWEFPVRFPSDWLWSNGYAPAFTRRGQTLISLSCINSVSSNIEKSIPVPEGCLNFWSRPCWKDTVTGSITPSFTVIRSPLMPSLPKNTTVMLHAGKREKEG